MRQLRIATIGDYQKWFSYFLMGTAQGSFLNGHLHYSIPIRQNPLEIETQLEYFRPHIVFSHMIFSENLKDYMTGKPEEREMFHDVLIRSRKNLGFKMIYQEGDAKLSPRYPYPVNELVDLALINSQQTEVFSALLRVPCIHWPYFALNQTEVSSGNNSFRFPVIFAGNVSANRGAWHLHSGRYEFIHKLRNRVDVKIFPSETIKNTRFLSQEVASSAEIVLGINQGMRVPGYLDTRPFQYIGAGALFFMDPSPAMDLFFEPGVHYVPYARHSVEDFLSQREYYFVHNRDKVKEIRKEGFSYVQEHHSAKRRVQMAIDAVLGNDTTKYKIYLNDIREYKKSENKGILDRGLRS